MALVIEGNHPFEGVVSEANNFRSRDEIVIKSGAGVVKPGAVLGLVVTGTAQSAAKAGGNTGNGTLTMDVTNPIRTGAKPGVYTVRFTAAATNNGTFRVEDPDGNVIGDVVMAGGAGAFDDDIKFAVADGGTDFVIGDGFDITVSALGGKYVPHNPAGTDGSQAPRAIMLSDVDATSADKRAAGLTRDCEFRKSSLIYNAATNTDPLKAEVDAALKARGIIIRT